MAARDFIGRGWSYPFRFDRRTGGVAVDQGEGANQQLARIRQSLLLIAGTKRGELYFSRRLGSRLRNLLFTLNTANLTSRIRFEVQLAFEDEQFGEKRAFIDRILVQEPTHTNPAADIEVFFVLERSNVEGNLVFPLYLIGAERGAAERGLSA